MRGKENHVQRHVANELHENNDGNVEQQNHPLLLLLKDSRQRAVAGQFKGEHVVAATVETRISAGNVARVQSDSTNYTSIGSIARVEPCPTVAVGGSAVMIL